MKNSIQSTLQPTGVRLTQRPLTLGAYFFPLLLASAWLVQSPPAGAVTPYADPDETLDASQSTLVFSDDFSTDPNTNGQWTIHRHAGDPNTEAVWDSFRQVWHLTLDRTDRAVAVFANYDLTAKSWRAEFRYQADNLGGLQQGGDGFVFMFYKNNAAYGTPASGAEKGFEVGYGTPVAGYGLQFDNYIQGCDPQTSNYFALIQNDVCTFLVSRAYDWIGANNWHVVHITFAEGRIKISIDGEITLNTQLRDPDYSFSGIGFGAGTGSAYGDYQIDDFRLWVSE